jgi:hypothetical protein
LLMSPSSLSQRQLRLVASCRQGMRLGDFPGQTSSTDNGEIGSATQQAVWSHSSGLVFAPLFGQAYLDLSLLSLPGLVPLHENPNAEVGRRHSQPLAQKTGQAPLIPKAPPCSTADPRFLVLGNLVTSLYLSRCPKLHGQKVKERTKDRRQGRRQCFRIVDSDRHSTDTTFK